MRNNLASTEGKAYSGHATTPEMDMTEKPPKPGFDTMKGLKALEKGGLDRPAAEAIVLFAEEATAHLATKDQVIQVEERLTARIVATDKQIVQVEERLIARIDNTAIRERLWLGGMVIATSLALAAYLSWMLPLAIDARQAPQQQPAVQQAER